MPELPDLNVFAWNRNKTLAGKKIKVENKRKLRTPLSKLKKALEGNRLKEVVRQGKELQFVFSNGNVLGMHLKLHGNLYLNEKRKNTIADYILTMMMF